MKRLYVALLAFISLSPIHASQETLSFPEVTRWADGMAEALITNFWGASFKENPDRYFFNKMSRQADMGTGDYWPQAHAIDVITDAYLRTKDKKYYQMYDLWWQGMPRFNPCARQGRKKGDPWWNVYVDDMEWHCLALIRIYEATGETRYLNKARQIYSDWIWPQWGPEDEAPWYGGITWKTDVAKSKNACSNGPASIIAARLAQFASVDVSNDKNKSAAEYQNEAWKIYQWERKYLWDSETGAIFDNINQEGRIGRFSLSYNQGTFIGAAVELFRLTKDHSLLDDAITTVRYTTGPMSQRNHGVLPDATGGDGGLFHGIFFRYLANLIVLPELDDSVRQELTDYLLNSASVLTRQGLNPQTMLYGGRWRQQQPASEPSALNPHVTGCTLLEAACKILAATQQPKALTELLPLFTAENVPEVGPEEETDMGGPFDWIADKATQNPNWPGDGLNRYPMLYIGEGYNRIFLINDDKIIWKYDTGPGWELDDLWMLKNGDILFTRMSWCGKVTPDKRLTWRYDCRQGEEIHSIQPIGDQEAIMLVNAFPARLVRFNHVTGVITWEKVINFDTDHTHVQSRRFRITADSTLLVCHLGENKVVEYDFDLNIIRQFNVSKPWAAIRLADGNTLITLEDERRTIEVDANGNTVWEIRLDEIPEPYRLIDCQSVCRLQNGNTILCSRGNYGHYPQLVEITRDKKVVWAVNDWQNLGPATSVQILSEQGLSEIPGLLTR